MTDRQRGELLAMAREEYLGADHEPARSQLDHLCEDCIEVTFGAGIQDKELQAEAVGRRQHLLRFGLSNSGIGWVDEQGHDARRGYQFVQQFKLLRH